MQLFLFVLSGFALTVGDMTAFVNSSMSLAITFLPNLLERRYDIGIDTPLVLWITASVFFHAFGAINLTGTNIYGTVWWWDHFTHALSASVVSAAGYISLRALEEHSNEIYIPRKFTFVFILIFVMAFGVIWEVLEFMLSELTSMIGTDTILSQHGLEDTMKDLVFDTAGGLIVAFTGEIYLNGMIEQLKEKLGEQISLD